MSVVLVKHIGSKADLTNKSQYCWSNSVLAKKFYQQSVGRALVRPCKGWSNRFDDYEMIYMLLETDHVKARSIEEEKGGYLLMYDGECDRPYPSVMIWRYATDERTNDNLITDMDFEDSDIIEYVWNNYLMEEGHDQEYTRPGYFILMEKNRY